MKLNISNLLTLARILVIPIIVVCIYLKSPFYGWVAFVLFCLASITDYFDGYIARIRNEITNFGTFLDPIADKLLVAAVILILTSKKIIVDWETIPALIILLREIVVSGLREYLAGIKVSVPVTKIAKFNILKHTSSSYFRIEVKDLPGVLSSITKIFAKNKISIKNLLQSPNKRNKKATIIIITHKNLEKNYNNLFSNLIKNKFVLKKPTFIRIEKV